MITTREREEREREKNTEKHAHTRTRNLTYTRIHTHTHTHTHAGSHCCKVNQDKAGASRVAVIVRQQHYCSVEILYSYNAEKDL